MLRYLTRKHRCVLAYVAYARACVWWDVPQAAAVPLTDSGVGALLKSLSESRSAELVSLLTAAGPPLSDHASTVSVATSAHPARPNGPESAGPPVAGSSCAEALENGPDQLSPGHPVRSSYLSPVCTHARTSPATSQIGPVLTMCHCVVTWRCVSVRCCGMTTSSTC